MQLRDSVAMGMPESLLPPGSKLEFFCPTIYDQGEMSASGKVAPLWFPDRTHPALAAGSLIAGLSLLTLNRSLRAAGITRRHITRAMMYGLAPFAMLFVMTAVWMGVAALGHAIPLGRSGYKWLGRIALVERTALPIWLCLYWWCAVRTGLRLPRIVAVAAMTIALLVTAGIILSHWRFWAYPPF